MVSGCIAAVNNNGIGIAGIAGAADIRIAPYRTGGLNEKDKDLQLAYVCAAIMDAAARPEVKVINMSFGTYNNFETLQTAVADAANAGKILVAAAGNEGDLVQYTGKYSYPASYDNVISVGATTNQDSYATFSQYNNQVDLSAPGFQLFTTTKNGDYSIASGTSFSAPVISGACAVLKAVDSNLTASGVENILKETALDLGAPGRDNYFGAGLIQLDKAVESVLPKMPLSLDSFSTDKTSSQEINTSILLSAMATGGQSPCEYKFYYLLNGVNIILNDFSPDNSVMFIPRQAGSYTLLVEVKDADGTLETQSINDFLILEPAVNATSITFDKTSMSIMVGASETIIATLTPTDITDKSITWSSSDAGIATVDASGNVKGIKIGKADIIAKTSNNLMSSCSVTINEKTMTTSTVEASVSEDKIIVTIKEIDVPNEVKQILVPIWSDINGQDNILSDTAVRQSDDSYSVSIDIKTISTIMGFIAFILIVQIIIVKWLDRYS